MGQLKNVSLKKFFTSGFHPRVAISRVFHIPFCVLQILFFPHCNDLIIVSHSLFVWEAGKVGFGEREGDNNRRFFSSLVSESREGGEEKIMGEHCTLGPPNTFTPFYPIWVERGEKTF